MEVHKNINHSTELPECTFPSAQSHGLECVTVQVSASWHEGRQMETGTAERDSKSRTIKFNYFGLAHLCCNKEALWKIKSALSSFCCQNYLFASGLILMGMKAWQVNTPNNTHPGKILNHICLYCIFTSVPVFSQEKNLSVTQSG